MNNLKIIKTPSLSKNFDRYLPEWFESKNGRNNVITPDNREQNSNTSGFHPQNLKLVRAISQDAMLDSASDRVNRINSILSHCLQVLLHVTLSRKICLAKNCCKFPPRFLRCDIPSCNGIFNFFKLHKKLNRFLTFCNKFLQVVQQKYVYGSFSLFTNHSSQMRHLSTFHCTHFFSPRQVA